MGPPLKPVPVATLVRVPVAGVIHERLAVAPEVESTCPAVPAFNGKVRV
jgi:hypothetical protein